MGVMYCSREYCENIMCDRHSYEYGYLCDSCFDELVHLGVTTDIHNFLGNKPNPESITATEAYFDSIFPRR